MTGPGLFHEPLPSEIDYYEQRGDGRWYLKEGVGDVNSDEKGSGARYNTGKPPMHYIPFEQQLKVLWQYADPDVEWLLLVLEKLSGFEKREYAISNIVAELGIDDLHEATYVWAYGANKYSAWNWAKGMAWSIPLACISRHAQAIIVDREPLDKESGCTHWGHIVCNLLMLDHYSSYYKAGDDRPPKSIFEEG